MKAVVIDRPGSAQVTEVPDCTPGPGEVVVEVDACGICGTDHHILAGENPNVRFPLIPGHEFAGTIVAIADSDSRFAVGDRVAVDPSISCGHCAKCRAGQENLCPHKGGYGTKYNGGFAEFAAVRDANCEPLPESVPLAWGAVAEPLACVLHGMDRLGPVLGQRVLVYGAGPIGLLAIRLLAMAAPQELAVVELNGARRDHAAAFGAQQSVTAADELAHPDGFDVVVDATGAPAAMTDGLGRLTRGGRFLVLGVARPDARIEVSPFDINWREFTILGSMAILGTYGRAVSLLAAGQIDAGRLITAQLPLAGFTDALASLGAADQLKVQLRPR